MIVKALVASMLCASTLLAQAQTVTFDSITWLKSESSMSKDFLRSAGSVDPMLEFIKQQTPQISHQLITANAKRSWQLLRQGDRICIASAVRNPERERLAYFSNTELTPPLRLIVRKDKAAALPLNKFGEVDLGSLLNTTQLRGTLVNQRSYGTAIDKLLAERPPNQAISVITPSDFGVQVLQMIARDRADYTIEYHQAMLMVENRQQTLLSFPIAGVSELMLVGVACPRNHWGLAAIQLIDAALSTPAGVAMLRQTSARWATGDELPRFAVQIDAFYKSRAQATQFGP
ncbi:TIGR02285 family protein [Paucibacter sp. TC2R-5]|uniref:TIGR02285 family protein n=1 Tax=Paucibacter sp. TC2R-5 TaxID=2893555 RepID=UPI0021E4EC8B|nr:TIGR02285 family protein [Paucibacter sp. TC2R-5]MCV2359399.1 TIGR02285 family protein [Paucibacter sp. TC2R-5]